MTSEFSGRRGRWSHPRTTRVPERDPIRPRRELPADVWLSACPAAACLLGGRPTTRRPQASVPRRSARSPSSAASWVRTTGLSISAKGRAWLMTSSASTFPLDAYYQARLELWRSASIELSIGSESTDPLVQVGIEVVLAWLRVDAATPEALLKLYGLPHGALGLQLRLIGSLLDAPPSPTDHHHP